MNMNGLEKVLSSAATLTEENTKRLGIAAATVVNESGVVKMKILYESGQELVLDNVTTMQAFVDESVKDIAVLDKIKGRVEGTRGPMYGKNKI